MAKDKKKNKKGSGSGFSPRIYQGLNDKRMAKGTGGNRLVIKQGETETVQFPTSIKDFREFDIHQFQEKNKWQYVPCAGDDCPLCDDDDDEVRRTHYRFCCNVWAKKQKKVLILEGPKDLSGRISMRAKSANKGKLKKIGKFNRKLYDVSKLKTTPVSYDVESADGRSLSLDELSELELHDLDAYITGEMERYFGDSTPAKSGKSALDDDDDDDDADDDEYDLDELLDMKFSEVKRIAKQMKVRLTDSDGEDRTKKQLAKLIIKKQ